MKHTDARIYSGRTNFGWSDLNLNSDGLLPIIVQDFIDHTVLMYGYMNKDAWEKTLATGLLTYFSKSHNRSLVKGKKSGNFQYIRELFLNFDRNALLAKVYQISRVCDNDLKSCFQNAIEEV